MTEADQQPVVVRCAHSALVDPRSLKPHPSNPNRHPAKQLEMFAAILRFQGWRRPITISLRSGYVTKGHGALETALAMGLDSVPIDQQAYDSQDAELADLAADNLLARMSEMETTKLTELLVHLEGSEAFDLQLTGLEERKIDKILTAFNERNPDLQGGASTSGSPVPVIMGESTAVQAAPASETPGPEPQRSILLFLSPADAEDFVRICAFFRKELELSSDVEAVMAVMRSAFRSHTESDEETDPCDGSEVITP
jgi:hypothetical protein